MQTMRIGIAISVKDPDAAQLERCLDSVQRQIYKNARVMVCLSGHVSHDAYIVSRQYGFESRYYRESLGAAGDWNRCVRLLDDCDYVTFVHGDDYIDADHVYELSRWIGFCDICFASLRFNEPYWCRVAYAVKRRDLSLLVHRRTAVTDPNVTVQDILRRNTLPCFALMRKSCWDKLGGYAKWCDIDLWVRALQSGMSMTSCPVPTYNYTVHSYPKGYKETVMKEINKRYAE